MYDFLRVRHCLTMSYTFFMRTSPTVTISLPSSMVEMLDIMANDRHVTRSQFIRDILLQPPPTRSRRNDLTEADWKSAILFGTHLLRFHQSDVRCIPSPSLRRHFQLTLRNNLGPIIAVPNIVFSSLGIPFVTDVMFFL